MIAAVVKHHFTAEWFPKWKHVVKSDEMMLPDYRAAATRTAAHSRALPRIAAHNEAA